MIDNETLKDDEEMEINLGELFQEIKKNAKLIIISVLTCAVIAAVVTIFFISKKYTSTANIFPKPDVTEGVVDYTQINSNNLMVNNYVELLKGNNIQGQVAKSLDMQTNSIKSAVRIENKADTQIITISATTTDPELSKSIVDNFVSTFKSVATETLGINNITTVDQAEIATAPVSPSLKTNLLIGTMLGAVLSIGFVFIRHLLDTHIHNKEEAEKYLGVPMLGSIPYFEE